MRLVSLQRRGAPLLGRPGDARLAVVKWGSWMDLAAPGEGARLLRTAILAGEPDSSPEICDLLKRVDLFRLRPQLTRQVEIVMASVGVGCHFGSALVSERLFPKRFCPITHARITL